MKYLISVAVAMLAFSSTNLHAYSGVNGNQGRALGPEVQCMLKNGDVVPLPIEYCNLLQGKKMQ